MIEALTWAMNWVIGSGVILLGGAFVLGRVALAERQAISSSIREAVDSPRALLSVILRSALFIGTISQADDIFCAIGSGYGTVLLFLVNLLGTIAIKWALSPVDPGPEKNG
jgi:hypothetical protein